MLRTTKDVKDHDYKKIFIQAIEFDSLVPRKIRRLDFEIATPGASGMFCLQPKQLSFPPDSAGIAAVQQSSSSLDSKH